MCEVILYVCLHYMIYKNRMKDVTFLSHSYFVYIRRFNIFMISEGPKNVFINLHSFFFHTFKQL